MSRAIKILWIVIGCLFATGVVLTAVGLALGGTGGAYVDRTGIHFGNREAQTTEQSDLNTEAFKDVDISLVRAEVQFVISDAYGYDFTYTGTREPIVEVKNNELRVVEHSDNWRINIFNLEGFFNETEAKLTVYVPADALLDEVSLAVASGDTSLDAAGIAINELDCQGASGNMHLSGLSLGELSLDVASGDITLDEITAKSASIEMASGRLTCKNTILDALSIGLASGNISFEGEVASLIKLDVVSGDVDFNLTGSEADYGFSVEKLSGSVTVNGRDIGHSYQQGGGSSVKAHVEVEVTSGSINFTFTS